MRVDIPVVYLPNDAFEEMRRQAADVPEMDLEEINEKIRSVRTERKARKAARA